MVKRFREKPDHATAEQMLRSGDHSWNSGMFVWKADAILAEIQRQMPELYSVVSQISAVWNTPGQEETLQSLWPGIRSQTIDYGIMEKAERVAVLPAGGLGWSDVGSWDSLFEVLVPDFNGNVPVNAQHLSAGHPQHIDLWQQQQALDRHHRPGRYRHCGFRRCIDGL